MTKKRWIVLLGVLLLGAVLASGCAAQGARKGDTVSVDYTVALEDGTVYDTSSGIEPLKVTLGEGKVISGFEEALIGMRVGDSKTVTLPPEKAYGPHRPELVAVISKSKLPESVPAEVGQRLQGTGKNGAPLPMIITEVAEDTVTVDANSPLAGKTLTLDLKLIAIEENPATGGNISRASLNWAILAVAAALASGFIFFFLKKRGGSRPVSNGSLANTSERLLYELARLDDDFKATERTYRELRAQKKAELVRLTRQSKEVNGDK